MTLYSQEAAREAVCYYHARMSPLPWARQHPHVHEHAGARHFASGLVVSQSTLVAIWPPAAESHQRNSECNLLHNIACLLSSASSAAVLFINMLVSGIMRACSFLRLRFANMVLNVPGLNSWRKVGVTTPTVLVKPTPKACAAASYPIRLWLRSKDWGHHRHHGLEGLSLAHYSFYMNYSLSVSRYPSRSLPLSPISLFFSFSLNNLAQLLEICWLKHDRIIVKTN